MEHPSFKRYEVEADFYVPVSEDGWSGGSGGSDPLAGVDPCGRCGRLIDSDWSSWDIEDRVVLLCSSCSGLPSLPMQCWGAPSWGAALEEVFRSQCELLAASDSD